MIARTVLFVAVATDPFGAAVVMMRMRERRRAALASVVTAAVLFVMACTAGPSLLDWLDISAEAAEIAAGVVLLVPAITLCVRGDQLFLAGDRAGGWRRGIVPIGIPMLAGPAPLSVVAALAARRGRGDVMIAVGLAIALAAIALWFAARSERPRDERSVVEGLIERFLGAAMVFVAFALIADGVLGI